MPARSYPGYADAIAFPVSFADVRAGIKNGNVTTAHEATTRVNLVFANCIAFNGADSAHGSLSVACRDAYNEAVVGTVADQDVDLESTPKRQRKEPDRFDSEITTSTFTRDRDERFLIRTLATELQRLNDDIERRDLEDAAEEAATLTAAVEAAAVVEATAAAELEAAARAAEMSRNDDAKRQRKAGLLAGFFPPLRKTTTSASLASSSAPTLTASPPAAAAAAAATGKTRVSKRDRSRLENEATLQTIGSAQKRGNTNKASHEAACAAEVVTGNTDTDLSPQSVTDLVREIVRSLLRCGNLNVVLRVYSQLRERPEIIGLDVLEAAISEIRYGEGNEASLEETRGKYMTKSNLVKTTICEAIKAFGEALVPDNSHATDTNRHALHTVIAACTPDDPKLFEFFRQLIGISKHQHTKGLTLKKEFAERSTKHWILEPPAGTRIDKYNDTCASIVAKWLLLDHSRVNNEDQRPSRVCVGVTDTGATVYEQVSKRVLLTSKIATPAAFMDSDQYPIWLAEAKKTIKNPRFSYWRHVYPVLDARYRATFHTTECVCPTCVPAEKNLPKMYLEHHRWHREHVEALRKEGQWDELCADCADSTKNCPGAAPKWLKSTRDLQNELQCDAPTWHEVSYPSFNTSTGWIDWHGPWRHLVLAREDCSTGSCPNCGFANLYGNDGVTVNVGSVEDGDEGVAYACRHHGVESDHKSQLFHWITVPDGVSIDKKSGKISPKTRKDWVLSPFKRAECLRMLQDMCADYIKHMRPVRLRAFMAGRFDFLFHVSRAVWDRGVNCALDTVETDMFDQLVDMLVERCCAEKTAKETAEETAKETAEETEEEETEMTFPPLPPPPPTCYAPGCPNRGKMRLSSGHRCASSVCAARHKCALLVPPAKAWGVVEKVSDFATAVPKVAEFGLTGAQGIECHHNITAMHHSASILPTTALDLDSDAYTQRLANGVNYVVETVCDYVSVLSKHEHNKVFANNVEVITNHFLRTGVVPDHACCALWYKGKLVQGSTDFSTEEGQKICENDADYYPPAGVGEEECDFHTGPVWLLDGDDVRGPGHNVPNHSQAHAPVPHHAGPDHPNTDDVEPAVDPDDGESAHLGPDDVEPDEEPDEEPDKEPAHDRPGHPDDDNHEPDHLEHLNPDDDDPDGVDPDGPGPDDGDLHCDFRSIEQPDMYDRPAPLLRCYLSCDNCPQQYGVSDTHHYLQNSGLEENGGIPIVHTRFLPHHGKNETDAKNKELVWFLQRRVKYQNPVQPGAYQLGLAFAKDKALPGPTYNDPKKMPKLTGRWNHVRLHLVMYVPKNGFDELIGNCCADDTKVKNSKSFSHFAPHSSGEESTLYCRRNTCWCVPCSNGMPHLCEATELCGPVGEYTQLRTRAGRLNTRRGGTYRVPEGGAREDFWEGLESKDHVIVRIHPDDRDDAEDDEAFFVARITKDGAPAYKLATGGLHGGSFFEKGWYVTEFKWMHFVRVDPDTGDHLFKYYSKAKPTVYQANALVANADCYIKAEGGFKYDHKLKLHRLAKGVHDKIMMYCDLSVGHL